ncbi:MAG: glycosyltransferase family 4 protein [Actinomycetota bacterium]
MTDKEQLRWAVFNQSHSPDFQHVLAELANEFGDCLLFTGSPHPIGPSRLTIEVGPRYTRDSMISRVMSWLAFASFAARRAMSLPAETFTLFYTNPPILPIVAWLLHATRKLNYGIVVWDVYPDHLVAGDLVGPNHFVVRSWRMLNKRSYRAASVVITLGTRMAERIRAQSGCNGKTAILIAPYWANVDLIRPLVKETNSFAIEHGQVGKLTVMYAGNIGASHELHPLLDAARQLHDNKSISFLIVGDGLGKQALLDRIHGQGLANVSILPYQPWERLPEILASAEIAFVGQRRGTESLSIPSKTYTSLAAGCALIAFTSMESDLAELIVTYHLGEVASSSDPQAVTAAIQKLHMDRDQLETYRSNARQIACELFSHDKAIETLANALGPFIR